MEPQHYHEDLAAFALDALDPEERRAVEAHISACVACRLAAEEARCAAEQLAFASPVITPSPQLKQRLMLRLSSERPAARARRSPAWRALGVALVGVLGVLLVWNMYMNSQVSTLSYERAQLTTQLQTEWEILAQSDRVSRSLLSTSRAPGARGSIFMRPDGRQAMLVVDGLTPLSPDKVYRCWLLRGGTPYSAATFRVSEQGHAGVVLDAAAELQAYSRLTITIEPAEDTGSAPSGELVLAGDLW